MKILVLYPHPPEPDGTSLQGHYMIRGLKEIGVDVTPCDREDGIEKDWCYRAIKPDVVLGIGYWGNAPEVVIDPLKKKMQPVPWFNADGWVANYHEMFNSLPLVCTTSEWVKSTYERDGIKPDNLVAIPIGFDPDVFKPAKKDDKGVKELRKMLGIKDDELMILTAGGDVTSKGAQEMFKALAQIDKKFKKWKYVLKVWDSFSAQDHGREEDDLIDELELDRSKIKYLSGKMSPEFMAKLLQACDVYAGPSRLEGFGMIQLEAQACGKPVVSINVGGPKDTIVHDKTGYLVDVEHEIKLDREWVYPHMGYTRKMQVEFPRPKTFAYRADVDQLAKYTLKLLEDDTLRENMGKAAGEHALKNFSPAVTAKKLVDAIEKHILNNPNVKRPQGIAPKKRKRNYEGA